ncbi:hypothetical protein V6N13_074143 [Hibiscus sabdariffa]
MGCRGGSSEHGAGWISLNRVLNLGRIGLVTHSGLGEELEQALAIVAATVPTTTGTRKLSASSLRISVRNLKIAARSTRKGAGRGEEMGIGLFNGCGNGGFWLDGE